MLPQTKDNLVTLADLLLVLAPGTCTSLGRKLECSPLVCQKDPSHSYTTQVARASLNNLKNPATS